MTKLLRTLVLSTALVFALSFVPLAAFAEEGDAEEVTTTSDSSKTRGQELKDQLTQLKQQRQENKQRRLEENKLRVCEQRETRIKAIMVRSVTRAEKQLALFTKISDRVKAFYVDKGRTVANYDDLVAAVDAAKAKAEANLETLKTIDSFDCDAEDPKGNVEAF